MHAPRDVVAVTVQDLNGENDRCLRKIGRSNKTCKTGPRNQSQN